MVASKSLCQHTLLEITLCQGFRARTYSDHVRPVRKRPAPLPRFIMCSTSLIILNSLNGLNGLHGLNGFVILNAESSIFDEELNTWFLPRAFEKHTSVSLKSIILCMKSVIWTYSGLNLVYFGLNLAYFGLDYLRNTQTTDTICQIRRSSIKLCWRVRGA